VARGHGLTSDAWRDETGVCPPWQAQLPFPRPHGREGASPCTTWCSFGRVRPTRAARTGSRSAARPTCSSCAPAWSCGFQGARQGNRRPDRTGVAADRAARAQGNPVGVSVAAMLFHVGSERAGQRDLGERTASSTPYCVRAIETQMKGAISNIRRALRRVVGLVLGTTRGLLRGRTHSTTRRTGSYPVSRVPPQEHSRRLRQGFPHGLAA
jgi:hypothetical protein